MTVPPAAPERAKSRLDQWLWFTRFVRSRSLAARLCAAGAVAVNDTPARKPNQAVRAGDIVVLAHGGVQRRLRVLALGVRRGPAAEARTLYDEIAAAIPLRELAPAWVPLLDGDGPADRPAPEPAVT